MRPGLVLRHYYSEPQLIIFHSFSKTRSIIFSTLNPDPSRSDPDDSETRVRLLQQLLLQSETRSLLSPVGSVPLICLLYLKKKKRLQWCSYVPDWLWVTTVYMELVMCCCRLSAEHIVDTLSEWTREMPWCRNMPRDSNTVGCTCCAFGNSAARHPWLLA